MTTEEKISLLISFNDIPVLSSKHFSLLQELSTHSDSIVRSMVAPFLVEFINEKAKDILFKLAQDDEALVRMEAYDSLAVFSFAGVECFLLNAILIESDDLARSYAILSWADVVLSSCNNFVENIKFAQNQKSIQKSDDCLLSFCYAQYILGDRTVLDEILSFLKNENYQVRCKTLSLLSDIIDEESKKFIVDAISIMLLTEKTVAVKDRATRFLVKI